MKKSQKKRKNMILIFFIILIIIANYILFEKNKTPEKKSAQNRTQKVSHSNETGR
jgi:hypothetical protein